MKVELVTLVVPSLNESVGFYRDLLGYELADQGDSAGRGYALLRQRLRHGRPGVIRLLQAPAGASPNRPRPVATILDPGLAALEVMTADDGEAHNALTAAGVETLSWPQFYRRDGRKPGPTGQYRSDDGGAEYKTFTAIGPGGEALFISRGLSQSGEAWPPWPEPDSRFAGSGVVLSTRDRWPLLNVYQAVFAAAPGREQFLQQDSLNVAIGAPSGTYFRFGGLGRSGLYWREFRGVEPTPEPPFPTDLDKTGLAMVTLSTPDLDGARRQAVAAGLAILADDALPTLDGARPDGFRLRGAVGELIEIIGAKG